LTGDQDVSMLSQLAAPTRYLAGPGDLYQLIFLGEDVLSNNVRVTPDGYLHVPLLTEPLLASGRTVEELQAEIETGLEQYLVEPQVFLHLLELGSQHVFVLGHVTNPHLATSEPLSLAGVISACGGITKDGQRKQVIVIRRNPGGDPTVFDVNFSKLLEGRSLAPDIPLQRYDIVVVPKSKVANLRDFMMAVFGNTDIMWRWGINAIYLHQAMTENISIFYR